MLGLLSITKSNGGCSCSSTKTSAQLMVEFCATAIKTLKEAETNSTGVVNIATFAKCRFFSFLVTTWYTWVESTIATRNGMW